MTNRMFQQPEWQGKTEAEAVMANDDPHNLSVSVIAVALSAPDLDWAQSYCLQLALHPHPNVRGNAILGFGHLARRSGSLDEQAVKPLVEAALRDPDGFVRSQADSAADDLRHFLHWQTLRP